MKVIALVDGEHYPSVTRWGIASAVEAGHDVVLALVVGGIEKLGADRSLDLGPVPVARGEAEPRHALAEAIKEHAPEGILDLSDEPVLGYERRMELVAVALSMGVTYLGPDFRFEPPIVEPPLSVATLGVIGAGKRVAKTAISAHAARLAVAAGRHPIVVAMGRGGPADPVTAGPQDVTLEALMARADGGEHAASDYLEDALTAGVATIGARRCGGGLAGRPYATNVAEAARQAARSGADLVILEGSGASVPTVPWDAGILVAPATIPLEHLGGYFGPLRILLSDLLVFIMGGGSSAEPDNLSSLHSLVRRLRAEIRVAIAELQPVALADVRGKDAFFATTAHRELAGQLADRLERTSGCRVVKVSPHLADRAALEEDFASSPGFDVLLTELKAAAIDVAARRALERGAEVVFVDNRPRTVGGEGEIDELLTETVLLAGRRAQERI
ncbi:MAG: 2,3-diphosphoglycerate synthetase [Actinomycetota bacterium]